jgi:hypothetical protein
MNALVDFYDVVSIALVTLIFAVLLVALFLRRDLRRKVIAHLWRKLVL